MSSANWKPFYLSFNVLTSPSASVNTGLIIGLHPANERWRYFVTTSLIGWAQTLNQPWNISSQGAVAASIVTIEMQ